MTWIQEHIGTRERRILMGLVGGAAILLPVLLGGIYLPLMRERQSIIDEINLVEADLAPYRLLQRETPLTFQVEGARQDNERLLQELEQLRVRVNTLQGLTAPTANPGLNEAGEETTEEGTESRIDFKVALYDARERLQAKAAQHKVKLPTDLGMEETIVADENAQTRLWQLAAVVNLAEQTIDLSLPSIDAIEILPPVAHMHPFDETKETAREFPVRMEVQAPFEQLPDMLVSIERPEHFFALRRLWVEKIKPNPAAPLRTELTAGALLLDPPAPEPPEPVEQDPLAFRPPDDVEPIIFDDVEPVMVEEPAVVQEPIVDEEQEAL